MNKKDDKKEKKYLLVKVVNGTETYVNSRLEMDVRDVIDYEIINKDEVDEYDVVSILKESDDKDELLEYMDDLLMDEPY